MNNNTLKDKSLKQKPVVIAYYYNDKNVDKNFCFNGLYAINHCFIYPDISEKKLIAVDLMERENDHKNLIKKSNDANVKVMATIGHDRKYGKEPNIIPGIDYLVQIAEKPCHTIRFAYSVAKFCTKNGYAGVDLNWETPKKHQASLYECFVRTLNAIFKEKNLLFSITLPGQFDKTYYLDYKELSKNTDWINIMTYDFGNSQPCTITHNTPLCGIKKNVKKFVEHIPTEKLVLGLAFYGYKYIYVDEFEIGKCGERENKRYSVDDILHSKQNGENWLETFDHFEEVPFMYNEKCGELMSYDNEKSFKKKCDFVKKAKLKGVMYWSTYLDTKQNSNRNYYHKIVTNSLG